MTASTDHFGSDKSEFHLIRAETRLPPPSGLADTFPGQFVADDWPVSPDMFRHGCADVVQEGLFGLLARTAEISTGLTSSMFRRPDDVSTVERKR